MRTEVLDPKRRLEAKFPKATFVICFQRWADHSEMQLAAALRLKFRKSLGKLLLSSNNKSCCCKRKQSERGTGSSYLRSSLERHRLKTKSLAGPSFLFQRVPSTETSFRSAVSVANLCHGNVATWPAPRNSPQVQAGEATDAS